MPLPALKPCRIKADILDVTRDTTIRHRSDAIVYGWRRARQLGVFNICLGLLLRRHCTKAGILTVVAGWPLPKIINMDGCVEIDNCALYPGVRIECWRGAVVKIGKGTYLNRNTEIVAATSVTIGVDCKVARDVLIMDTDQHAVGSGGLVNKPVEIGDRVWIGSRAIVLKGVSIGHDSIVGAGAIVTKSVLPYSVIVGPAAKVLRDVRDVVAE